MCGRTACNLSPEKYCESCAYIPQCSSNFCKPKWTHLNNAGYTFHASTNIAPTDITPILVDGVEFGESARTLAPMMWGLIPPWHKGEPKKHGLSTINARVEGLDTSKLYGKPLSKGQRCVAVCEGYYEWKAVEKSKKQPYFIYAKQNENKRVEMKSHWDSATCDSDNGWNGPNLLKMAALYDVWKTPLGEEIYSYSVITMKSSESVSWIHERMPAIIDDDVVVQAWLDKRTPAKDAISLLKPTNKLSWHPVSNAVGHTSNKSENLHHPIELVPKVKKESSLDSWLKTGIMRKKPKLEV